MRNEPGRLSPRQLGALALTAAESGMAAIRINPGNIGGEGNVGEGGEAGRGTGGGTRFSGTAPLWT